MTDTTHVTTDRVLLIGMMGAGKTTVGNATAQLLGWPYYDNDVLLERAVGKDTRRVQQEEGEAFLRRAESAALTMALSEAGPLVAGVAGGVVTDPLDRERLCGAAFVVWLRASIDTLVDRVEGTDRPWLGNDPRKALTELYAGRADLYTSVASLVLDVDVLPPDVLALRIVEAVVSRDASPAG